MRALHITGHSEICNESPPSFAGPNATSPYRAERGKGRLWEAPANPYCFTNFECKADLSQPFKGNCSQIRSSVTGGAYNSVCRVTMCVRRDLSMGACLNCTRSTHQTVTKRPFSPHSFPAKRKRMGRRRHVGNGLAGTSLRYSRSLLSFESASSSSNCKRCAGLQFEARGDFDFPPGASLNRPRKPLRFSWIFPATTRTALKFGRQ